MSATEAEYRVRHQSFWFVACLAVLVAQIVAEYLMGRVPICSCGYVKLWEGGVNTSGNSQHLSDWYTPSHIIHGFLFYGLGHLVLRRKPLAAKLLLALVIESGWELLENSPLIIDRYRAVTVSFGYSGDAVINSLADIGFMALGFWIASKLPVWASVAMAIGFELFTLLMIRDNLTLNILMLVWPLDVVRAWQGG